MDLIWDPHPSPFAKCQGSPRSYGLANCSGAESWVEGLSSWIPHYTGAAMLTARPTPTPGREAGLDPGPAPEGSAAALGVGTWSLITSFCPAGSISHVFSHLPTPSLSLFAGLSQLPERRLRRGSPKATAVSPPTMPNFSRDPSHSASNSHHYPSSDRSFLCFSSPSSPSISFCSAPPTPRPTLLPSTPPPRLYAGPKT